MYINIYKITKILEKYVITKGLCPWKMHIMKKCLDFKYISLYFNSIVS